MLWLHIKHTDMREETEYFTKGQTIPREYREGCLVHDATNVHRGHCHVTLYHLVAVVFSSCIDLHIYGESLYVICMLHTSPL